jgi:hypothetical protein
VSLVIIGGLYFKTDIESLYHQFFDDSVDQKVHLDPGTYYVSAKKLNVRMAPKKQGELITTLELGDEVYVYETLKGWARLSEYFNRERSLDPEKQAQWVSANYLTAQKPNYANAPANQAKGNRTSQPIEQKPPSQSVTQSPACVEAQKTLREWDAYVSRNFSQEAIRKKRGAAFIDGTIAGGTARSGNVAAANFKANLEAAMRENSMRRLQILQTMSALGCK